jgi:hypothetical protein
MQPKLLMLAAGMIACSFLHAQFNKGQHLAGASIATGFFSSGKTSYGQDYVTNSHSWSIGLTPYYGWFLNQHAAAGFNLILNASGQKDWNESAGLTYKRDIRNNMDYGLGLFYRYYLSAKTQWLPFVHAYANAGSGRTRTSGFYYSTTINQTYSGKSSDRAFYNLGINAGLTRRINQWTGIDVFVGYGHSYSKMTTTTESQKNSGSGNFTEEYIQPQAFRGNAINFGIGFQFFPGK